MFNEGIKLETDLGQVVAHRLRICRHIAPVRPASDRGLDHGHHSLLPGDHRARIAARSKSASSISASRNPSRSTASSAAPSNSAPTRMKSSFAGEAAKLPVVHADRLSQQASGRLLRRRAGATKGAVGRDSRRTWKMRSPHSCRTATPVSKDVAREASRQRANVAAQARRRRRHLCQYPRGFALCARQALFGRAGPIDLPDRLDARLHRGERVLARVPSLDRPPAARGSFATATAGAA